MRQYTSLPIEHLVSDVAVDPVHVRELADSIKVSGPISPVLVREGKLTLIDGFHRVAAMKELGFQNVECIITPCDDETFWDLRIMSASLHKAVTFARVVDWIDEVFLLSPKMQRYKGSYKSGFSLFDVVSNGTAPEEVKTWALTKAQQWGLSVGTIRQWLYTRESLAPDLLAEAKSPSSTVEGRDLPFTHYYRVAETLSGQPELQKRVIEKAKEESLTAEQTREVARALRITSDAGEQATILSQPVGRTSEELVRAAKVDTILRSPQVIPPQVEKRLEFSGKVLEYWLHLQQVTSVAKALSPDILALLSREQRERLVEGGENCVGEIQRINDELLRSSGRVIEAGHQLGPSRLV